MAFLDEDGEEERRRRKRRMWDVGEGGCCLLELFSFALLIGVAGLAPLLMR